MDILHLILTLIVVGVIVWGALTLLAAIPMQETFKTAVHVIIVVAAVLYLIRKLFGYNLAI